MSVCIVAMVVFAFCGIFSARYRRWFRQALGCVTRRLTLRPCNADFQTALKAKITSKLMNRHPKLAGFSYRHFEAISAVFTVVMFISLAYTAYGMYNLAVYGTCDPVTGNCIFNPGGNPNQVVCPFEGLEPAQSVGTIGGFRALINGPSPGDRPLVYFIGTSWCPHCTWEKPIVTRVASRFGSHIDFRSIEIDAGTHTEEDLLVFNHFSPEGHIPLLVLGGHYFRIGAGESLGESGEEAALTALLCELTGSPISDCSESGVLELMGQI
jgi:hypothetical protein